MKDLRHTLKLLFDLLCLEHITCKKDKPRSIVQNRAEVKITTVETEARAHNLSASNNLRLFFNFLMCLNKNMCGLKCICMLHKYGNTCFL